MTTLFPPIVDFQVLRLAARRAIRGKRDKPMPAAFMAGLERELLKLERELEMGTCKRAGRQILLPAAVGG